MHGGGGGDDGRIHFAGELAGIGQRLGAVQGRQLGRAGGVGIHHRAELRPLGFVDGAAMVLSELAGADYS
jgi:hypothetical protein